MIKGRDCPICGEAIAFKYITPDKNFYILNGKIEHDTNNLCWEEEGLVDQENRINFSINYTQMLDFNERLLSTLTTAQEADMVLQYGDIDQHAGYDDIELWDFKALKEEINQ